MTDNDCSNDLVCLIEPVEPVCPYADHNEVCKKHFGKASEVPEGYKIMSQQDVHDNWTTCKNAMGYWDIISLLDGKVDGRGYGNNFADHHEVQCNSGRWMFLMRDRECEGSGLECN